MRGDNALSIQSGRESGLRVVGIFCAYSPMELVVENKDLAFIEMLGGVDHKCLQLA